MHLILRKATISLVLVITLIHQTVNAAEVDSVTPRSLKLNNSLALLNEIFNERIQQGVARANLRQADIQNISSDDFCDSKTLYKELRKSIFQSVTASWGLKGYDLDKQLRQLLISSSYSLPLNDSVYRDINYIEGLSLNLKELSDVVNINGHLVGLDKMGHFFAEGWRYFDLTRNDNKDIVDAMKWGRELEAGKYGYATTGIFSYADLVANFNGWRFWNQILLEEKDPLHGVFQGLFKRPYISCKTQLIPSIKVMKVVKAWKINHELDLSDYIDGSWDEGNNCNSYKDPLIEDKVAKRISAIKADFKCPFIRGGCIRARKKYGEYSRQLLHPYCLVLPE